MCWALACLADSGWSGFFIALLALQAVYFFFWLKSAVWEWLLFWIYRKRQMATNLENFFIDSRFPAPDLIAAVDIEYYLNGITSKVRIADTIRIARTRRKYTSWR